MIKKSGLVLIISLLVSLFASCGMEDYPYIYSIPTGNIRNELNSRVIIDIPGSNSGNLYFANYTIFYRIYISHTYIASPAENDYLSINSTLYNDHQRIRPYIGNDSMGSSTVISLFANMNFYNLSLEGQDIDYILSGDNGIFNKSLIIDFYRDSENESIPYMTLDSGATRYRLTRANGFISRPDELYFLNSTELRNSENIDDPLVNTDITDNGTAEKNFTYVSLYIVASGLDFETFTQLYSSPTHIGVLRLPDLN